LLLQEEKGCTNDTQLSFVNDKGELRHGLGLTFELILSRYWRMRRKQGNGFETIATGVTGQVTPLSQVNSGA
jgi:hypothetical protein